MFHPNEPYWLPPTQRVPVSATQQVGITEQTLPGCRASFSFSLPFTAISCFLRFKPLRRAKGDPWECRPLWDNTTNCVQFRPIPAIRPDYQWYAEATFFIERSITRRISGPHPEYPTSPKTRGDKPWRVKFRDHPDRRGCGSCFPSAIDCTELLQGFARGVCQQNSASPPDANALSFR